MTRSKKRPRPTLSCRECRQKKLRCDRVQPCQQCVKGQREALCVFNTGPPSHESELPDQMESEDQRAESRVLKHQRTEIRSFSAPTPAPHANGGVIEDLQARVAALEAIIRADPSLLDRTQLPGHDHQPIGTISVKGDRCRYYGNGFRTLLFERIQTMATSILQPSMDPDLWSLAKEVQGLSKRLAANWTSPPTSGNDALSGLRERLPGKDVCDFLVETYFSLYEQRFVVLHKPTFMPLYSDFMDERDQPPTSSPIEPRVYAAMGLAAYHLQSSGHSHQTAAKKWIRLSPFTAIETWLNGLSRRARAEVSALQTRALIILSQQARGLPLQEYWQATNALVRSAMTLGLHRDPEQLGRFSPRQADFRRRLWWSIVEMDLQASMSYGMPAAICPEDTDCVPGPLPNVPNSMARFAGAVTCGSGFVLQEFLSQSLLSRLAIVNTMSHPLDSSSRGRLATLWGEAKDAARDWPKLVDAGVAPMESGLKPAILSFDSLYSTLLISVQRYLPSEITSSVKCVHAAVNILTCLKILAHGHQEDRVSEPYLNLFLVEFMHDIHKAMTLISMHLDHCQDVSDTANPSLDPESLFQLLGDSLRVFVDKADFEYGNLKDIVALSISISLAKARRNKEEEQNVVRQGLRETFRSLHQVLSEATRSDNPSKPLDSTINDVQFDGMPTPGDIFDIETTGMWQPTDWLLDIDEAWL